MTISMVALAFILNIDEAICNGLFSEESKRLLDKCEPLYLYEASQMHIPTSSCIGELSRHMGIQGCNKSRPSQVKEKVGG